MIDPKVEAALRRIWDLLAVESRPDLRDEAHELLSTIRSALSQTPDPQTGDKSAKEKASD